MKRVFITGISSGLGKALAGEMINRGYNVSGCARKAENINVDGLEKKISLDITDFDKVREEIEAIGPIDILINNSAISVSGPAEAIPLGNIKQLFDTNFFGAVNLTHAIIPAMRENGGGEIVQISSPASQFAPLYGGFYAASKAALELWSEELYHELKHFNIDVIIMQCGAIDTRISEVSKRFTNNTYAALEEQMLKRKEAYDRDGSRLPPANAAKQIIDSIESKQAPFKTIIGNDAAYMLKLRKELSDAAWQKESPFMKNINW